ncbi:MAG: oligosaccharide flippase family protein [bacterium]
MIKRSDLAHIVRHAGLDAVGSIINMALMFISGVLITRTIGADLYGKYSIANNILSFTSVMAIFGMETGVLKIASKYIAKRQPSLALGTLSSGILVVGSIGLGTMVAILVFAPQIAAKAFPNVEGISWVIRVQIIALPFFSLTTMINAYTRSFKTLKYTVLVESLVRPALRLALILAMFKMGLRLEAVLYGSVSAFVIATFLSLRSAMVLSRTVLGNFKPARVTKELVTYSFPVAIAHITSAVLHTANTLIVGHYKDSFDTGLFSIAVQLSFYISVSLYSFAKIFSPVASDLWERQKILELGEVLKTVSKWVFSLGFLVFTVTMIFAPSILAIFGKEFAVGTKALRILAFGQILNAIGGMVGYLLPMTGRQNLNLVNQSIFATLTIILNIIMVPRWGIVGASLATCLLALITTCTFIIESELLYGFIPLKKDFLTPVAAGALTGLILYLFDLVAHLSPTTKGTLAICFIAVGIYGALLYKLGFKEEKDILLAAITKK